MDPAGDGSDELELGPRLRRLRLSRHLTLREVASHAGLSKGYVSQIENGTANPSLSVLKSVASALGESVAGVLLAERSEDSPTGSRSRVEVVRRAARKTLGWPGDGATENYLLTPDLQRRLEVLLTTMEPGSSSGESPYSHDGEEFGLVMKGRFEVIVEGSAYVLDEGDSISLPSALPHRTRVVGDEPATVLWVVTPPSF